MTVETSDFWQSHSVAFLEMAFRTDRREKLDNPDGYGYRQGECGDSLEFFLIIRDGRLRHVAFEINGCINTNAAANTVAEMAEGRTVKSAWEIMPEDVISYLETLPEREHHCAELALGAFYRALKDYDRRRAATTVE